MAVFSVGICNRYWFVLAAKGAKNTVARCEFPDNNVFCSFRGRSICDGGQQTVAFCLEAVVLYVRCSQEI